MVMFVMVWIMVIGGGDNLNAKDEYSNVNDISMIMIMTIIVLPLQL